MYKYPADFYGCNMRALVFGFIRCLFTVLWWQGRQQLLGRSAMLCMTTAASCEVACVGLQLMLHPVMCCAGCPG